MYLSILSNMRPSNLPSVRYTVLLDSKLSVNLLIQRWESSPINFNPYPWGGNPYPLASTLKDPLSYASFISSNYAP